MAEGQIIRDEGTTRWVELSSSYSRYAQELPVTQMIARFTEDYYSGGTVALQYVDPSDQQVRLCPLTDAEMQTLITAYQDFQAAQASMSTPVYEAPFDGSPF